MKMLMRAGVHSVVNDQCMFGLVAKGPDGVSLPARKPTRWMCNSIFMIDALNTRCDGSHSHQHLVGGRAAAAAFYPPDLLRAILRGIAMTRDAMNGVKMIRQNEQNLCDSLNSFVNALRGEPDPMNTTAQIDSEGFAANNEGGVRESSIPLVGGGSIPVRYFDHNFK